jgi:ketosteroid isomerase-like protein
VAEDRKSEDIMDKAFAENFAKEWIAAWNSHDLDRILEHYEDNFEMSSPIIRTLADEPSGTLRGKAAVRSYWAKARKGATVYYKGHRGLSAEVFHFGPGGKVRAAFAHYAEASL